ncbi:MAG: hypothetical protein P8163_03635 [Candidatus Thiodiazotropha sp.]
MNHSAVYVNKKVLCGSAIYNWLLIITLCCGYLFTPDCHSTPRIDRSEAQNNIYSLYGIGFGETCMDCEVIADYSTIRYSLETKYWSDKRIIVKIPDLNLGTQVALQVKTGNGNSNKKPVKIKRRLVPPNEISNPIEPVPANYLSLRKSSNIKVGAKGTEQLDVSTTAPTCGAEALLFDHAEILFSKRRFGDAQFTSLPKPGCSRCTPLILKWYHEPTGHLDFQLLVYRRVIDGICPNRLR